MTAGLYVLAALAEIAGCFALWAWWRQGASVLWLVPGTLSLVLFAWLLALTPPGHAGRSFAVYGGVYIACALAWLRVVEQSVLRPTDLVGAALAIAGAAVILWGAR